MNEPAWVIVQTRTRCEDIVAQGFLNAGYRSYVPRQRVLTWPHGQHRKAAATMRAIFSGLVFVQDWRGWPDKRDHPISQVVGLMMAAGVPAKLSGDDIAILMDRERRGLYEPHAPRPPANGVVLPDALTVGDAVEYDLAGTAIEAVIDELSASGRATIRALIFGRQTKMQVDAAELRTVSA